MDLSGAAAMGVSRIKRMLPQMMATQRRACQLIRVRIIISCHMSMNAQLITPSDLNLYRCKCRVPSAHHSYAVDIQRRIEPLVASVVRLEHQVEQLAHHFLNDTENFVRTGHHHEGPNIQGNTDKPTVASSKLNGNNPLTTNKEVVPEMMGGEYSPPSLDGKRFQHPPPPNLSWNQEPEHKDHEPMALTIAKLEHQVRYLMHRMGEMLREGAMVKETEAEREAWEHSHEQRGLVKEMKDDKSAGQHTDMHQEGG